MVHTGISLNDRFTQMQSQAVKQSRPQRSRSQSRSRRIVNPSVSAANSRLLQEFKRKHTVQTALKLKRRSLRNTAGGGGGASRGPRIGGVKPVRLGPNGRPMRSNNVTHVATMRADLVANARRRSNSSNRPTRSSSQVGGLRQRLGQRRSNVGGAAERVERRRQQQQQQQQQQLGRRNRSRSRSRQAQPVRSRSQSRGRERSQSRPRSQSRNRFAGGRNAGAQRRGGAAVRSSSSGRRVSVKQRLGVRPGQAAAGSPAVGKGNRRVPRRGASKLRGVAGGRVEKRRNSSNQTQKGVSASLSGRGRQRGRSAAAAPGAVNSAAASTSRRSRSRTRAAVNAGLATTTNRPIGRGKVANKAANRNGNKNNNNNNNNNRRNRKSAPGGKAKPHQQQAGAVRRGRSRNRANRSDSGKAQPEVKREDLDNELDQYMSTTKSEMDYLLK
ncbi:arginine/serine-rich protein 1 [Drosophila tropicalis]|uniref:arginine/serine-rich protein 1 n=1 Tax=Drosophila tropicalis TaxID=46794 RepID=UPI0035ABFC2B